METIAYVVFSGLFLATSPLLLIVRMYRSNRMPWWLLVLLAALLGWVWINLSVYFYFERLGAQITQLGELAPQELIDRWANDGAKRVFALYFGWLYGLVYLAPWLLLYALLFYIGKQVTSRRVAA